MPARNGIQSPRAGKGIIVAEQRSPTDVLVFYSFFPESQQIEEVVGR